MKYNLYRFLLHKIIPFSFELHNAGFTDLMEGCEIFNSSGNSFIKFDPGKLPFVFIIYLIRLTKYCYYNIEYSLTIIITFLLFEG